MPPDSPTPMRASASVATLCAMSQKTVEARGKGQIWHDTIVGRAQERNRRLLE